jgi:hypothetical protein
MKLESPEPKLKTAAAVLVNTACLSLTFNVTFLICITFNLPLWLAFAVNAIVALSSIFRVYSTIRSHCVPLGESLSSDE